jgi:hypothetical protein
MSLGPGIISPLVRAIGERLQDILPNPIATIVESIKLKLWDLLKEDDNPLFSWA